MVVPTDYNVANLSNLSDWERSHGYELTALSYSEAENIEEYYGNIGKGRKRASLMHDPARASSYCYLRGVADAPCRRVPSCRRGRTI